MEADGQWFVGHADGVLRCGAALNLGRRCGDISQQPGFKHRYLCRDCFKAVNTPTAPAAEAQLAQLLERRRVYIEYARHRIDDEDWHGCSDAANDLRELDAEIRMHRSHHGL